MVIHLEKQFFDVRGNCADVTEGALQIALRLFDETGQGRPQSVIDSLVLGAVERSLVNGSKVLLQIMDSSKFGLRAPSEKCLEEIAARWPRQVQIVVDACQMRLGRARLRNYLDRGYWVIITGSKFFTGPPFSGALLLPSMLAADIDSASDIPSGFFEYFGRSDWPQDWPNLRSHFPVRMNLGQWLRWEAALEEIDAYFRVPSKFRLTALTTFGEGVERIVGSSPSLLLLPPQHQAEHSAAEDEEMARRTIFPFLVRRGSRILSLEDCRALYRSLAGGAASDDRETESKPCLIGQPVVLGRADHHPAAALRISASARIVSQAFSSDEEAAQRNLQRALDDVSTVVANIEKLLLQMNDHEPAGVSYGV